MNKENANNIMGGTGGTEIETGAQSNHFDHPALRRRGRAVDAQVTDAEEPQRTGAASVESSGFSRNRGPGRRRTEYRRAAEEGQMNDEQLDFLKAVEEYKRVNNRPFPSCCEYLDILLYLGYRKIAPIGEFQLTKNVLPFTAKPRSEAEPSS